MLSLEEKRKKSNVCIIIYLFYTVVAGIPNFNIVCVKIAIYAFRFKRYELSYLFAIKMILRTEKKRISMFEIGTMEIS